MYTIEHNIPVQRKRGAPTKYPFGEMRVGDSFFVPGPTKIQNSIRNCFYRWRRDSGFDGFEISIRAMGDGHRVWRTA